MAVAERERTTPAEGAEERTPQPYRWTREQFNQIGDLGLFEGRRAILVEGEIFAIPAMDDLHRNALILASDVLRDLFGGGFFVSVQCPFDIGRATDPEPDSAIIRGSVRDYFGRGLTEAALIVEVSDTTLAYDCREKASLYALAGVTDYWIININQEPAQIEVHRQPAPDETQPHGFGYQDRTVHQGGDIIQPLSSAKPVAVSTLLP